jgi:hypothetical protein
MICLPLCFFIFSQVDGTCVTVTASRLFDGSLQTPSGRNFKSRLSFDGVSCYRFDRDSNAVWLRELMDKAEIMSIELNANVEIDILRCFSFSAIQLHIDFCAFKGVGLRCSFDYVCYCSSMLSEMICNRCFS